MAICVTLRPFDHEIFNSLPSIEACDEAFRENNGAVFVDSYAKSLLIKHNLEHVFGFGLLHRHFALRKNEKLVEHNNIFVPWEDIPEPSPEKKHDISVLPDALMMTHDGNLMLYEYCSNPMNKKVNVDFESKEIQSFLIEFTESVKKAGLEPYLGLCRYPKGFVCGLERTEGRANIMFLPGQFPEAHLKNSIETMWFFPRIEQKRADRSVSMVPQATIMEAECSWYGGECKNQSGPAKKENVLSKTPKTETVAASCHMCYGREHKNDDSLTATTEVRPGKKLEQNVPFKSLPPSPLNPRCAACCSRKYEKGKEWHHYDGHRNPKLKPANSQAEQVEGGLTKPIPEALVNSKCSGYCAKSVDDHGSCHTTYDSEVDRVDMDLVKKAPGSADTLVAVSKVTGNCSHCLL